MFEIVLSSTVTKLVPVPKSGTVREAIGPLLARQKFSFETVDVKSAASLQVHGGDMVCGVSCSSPKAPYYAFLLGLIRFVCHNSGLQLDTRCWGFVWLPVQNLWALWQH